MTLHRHSTNRDGSRITRRRTSGSDAAGTAQAGGDGGDGVAGSIGLSFAADMLSDFASACARRREVWQEEVFRAHGSAGA